jgi:hypothetical protein
MYIWNKFLIHLVCEQKIIPKQPIINFWIQKCLKLTSTFNIHPGIFFLVSFWHKHSLLTYTLIMFVIHQLIFSWGSLIGAFCFTGLGLLVFLDIVHSYSAADEMVGLSLFDGSNDCYFHTGKTDLIIGEICLSPLCFPTSFLISLKRNTSCFHLKEYNFCFCVRCHLRMVYHNDLPCDVHIMYLHL